MNDQRDRWIIAYNDLERKLISLQLTLEQTLQHSKSMECSQELDQIEQELIQIRIFLDLSPRQQLDLLNSIDSSPSESLLRMVTILRRIYCNFDPDLKPGSGLKLQNQ